MYKWWWSIDEKNELILFVRYVQMMVINWWKKWIDFVEKLSFIQVKRIHSLTSLFCPHDDPQVGTQKG